MDTSSQLITSTNAFFTELEKNKDAVKASWSHITQTIDAALAAHDDRALLALIPYIEQGEGTLAYEYIAESRCILRILHIIRLELAYQKAPFFLHCTDKDSLTKKYTTSLFALRRLFFRLSPNSMEEAANRLLSSRLSVFAVYVMTQEDLITPDKVLYDKIAEICFSYWDDDDKKMFLLLTAKENRHE